ncbi:AMP1 protein, partial [Leucopsar rothschildi]|nr:AMP1 protein [Leucopsar rothschildi]
MKILFLLFPLIVLLVQGAAGNEHTCWKVWGFCFRRECPRGTINLGKCAQGPVCCKKSCAWT